MAVSQLREARKIRNARREERAFEWELVGRHFDYTHIDLMEEDCIIC